MADVEIHWKINGSASCFHVAECLIRKQPVNNEALAQAFAPLVARLAEFIHVSGLPSATFLAHLVPLSAQLDSNRPLATAVLAKTFGPQKGEKYLPRLTDLLTEFEGTFHRAVPTAVEELAHSAAGLRQHWAAHGQTLLAGIAQLIEPEVIVPSATVLLVPPVCGGGGQAYFLYNTVSIEVVDPAPIAELPEVVRLCWLIAQLNADLPMYQGEIHRNRLLEIVPLAMIPAALAAAAELSLARIDEPTIRQAIKAWVAETGDASSTAASLWNWWETYINRKPSWTVALAALDELLT